MTLIAVVNDDPQLLRLMELILNDEGYDVLSVQKQSTAFPTLLEAQPDLLILDLHMDTDDAGLMVLDLVRLDSSTAGIPVIVCSAAHGLLERRAEYFARHQAKVLRKPFVVDDLVSLVQECIGPPS